MCDECRPLRGCQPGAVRQQARDFGGRGVERVQIRLELKVHGLRRRHFVAVVRYDDFWYPDQRDGPEMHGQMLPMRFGVGGGYGLCGM